MTLPDDPKDLSEDQRRALTRLAASLQVFVQELEGCTEQGITAVEALRAIGLEIPSIAAPMLDQMLPALKEHVA